MVHSRDAPGNGCRSAGQLPEPWWIIVKCDSRDDRVVAPGEPASTVELSGYAYS